MSSGSKPPEKISGGRFVLSKKLGAGCFGQVWRGEDTERKVKVAVKLEEVPRGEDVVTAGPLQLDKEHEILMKVAKPAKPQGFAECFYLGAEAKKWKVLVMDLLGKSLEDTLQGSACKGRFTEKTAVLVAEQVLHRIEYLHSKGIVHRDIKPENFVFGIDNKVHHLYIIDFGLSKSYYSDHSHISMPDKKLSLTGTARYASINAHEGREQSRRDDLEAIGHMFLYFLRGSLPWSGLDAKTQDEKYRKICEKKKETPLNDLCAGFPQAFENYLGAARNLQFKERPDYGKLRKLFQDVRQEIGDKQGARVEDHHFQFLDNDKNLGSLQLEPLVPPPEIQQPDDQAPKSGGWAGCFSCGGKSAVRD